MSEVRVSNLDLRPLSLGEILDRTFTLYRRNFLLFLGITALPQLLILGLNMAQLFWVTIPTTAKVAVPAEHFQARSTGGLLAFGFIGLIIGAIVYLVAYLFAQGGTVYAVSDLYLGRPTSIGASLGKMRPQLASLFGVTILNGLAVMGATLLLIIPGIYVACRLITCVPAALLEDLGASQSLERSFTLTKDNAGRAFVIYFLYFVMLYAAMSLFTFPFIVGVALSAKDPGMMHLWLGLSQVGSFLAGILVGPFLMIAVSVFYYDLRIRKEAFDLQYMLNPGGNNLPTGTPGVPSILS
jgi:hypothetical protein